MIIKMSHVVIFVDVYKCGCRDNDHTFLLNRGFPTPCLKLEALKDIIDDNRFDIRVELVNDETFEKINKFLSDDFECMKDGIIDWEMLHSHLLNDYNRVMEEMNAQITVQYPKQKTKRPSRPKKRCP